MYSKPLSIPDFRRQGTTLLELILACALLSGLIVVTFWIFRMGSQSWKSVEAQSALQSELQIAVTRLTREIERSTYGSLSLDPPVSANACSLLSAWDEGTSKLQLNPLTGAPDWGQYHIFYLDSASKEFCHRTLNLAIAAPERQTPEPIELYDLGGLLPLASYRVQGRPLARWVDQVTLSANQGLLQGHLQSSRTRSWHPQPERFELRFSCHFRN